MAKWAEDDEMKSFSDYIQREYVTKKTAIAKCYRNQYRINVSMHLESFHKQLKYRYDLFTVPVKTLLPVSSVTRHFCSCLKRNTGNHLDELVQVILDQDRAKTLEIIFSEATQLQDSSRIKGTTSSLSEIFVSVNKILNLGV